MSLRWRARSARCASTRPGWVRVLSGERPVLTIGRDARAEEVRGCGLGTGCCCGTPRRRVANGRSLRSGATARAEEVRGCGLQRMHTYAYAVRRPSVVSHYAAEITISRSVHTPKCVEARLCWARCRCATPPGSLIGPISGFSAGGRPVVDAVRGRPTSPPGQAPSTRTWVRDFLHCMYTDSQRTKLTEFLERGGE